MTWVQDKINEIPVKDVGLDGLELVHPKMTPDQTRLQELLRKVEGQRLSFERTQNIGQTPVIISRVRRHEAGVFTHYEWFTELLNKSSEDETRQTFNNFLFTLQEEQYTLEKKLQDWRRRTLKITPTHDYELHKDFGHKDMIIYQDHWYTTKEFTDGEIERFLDTIDDPMDRSDSLIGYSILQDKNFLTQRHMYMYAGLCAFRRQSTENQDYIKCRYSNYGQWYGPLLEKRLELDYTDEDRLPREGRVVYALGNTDIKFKKGFRSLSRREDDARELIAEASGIEQEPPRPELDPEDEDSIHSSDYESDNTQVKLLPDEQNLDDYDDMFPRHLTLRLRQVEIHNRLITQGRYWFDHDRLYTLPYWEWKEDDWFWKSRMDYYDDLERRLQGVWEDDPPNLIEADYSDSDNDNDHDNNNDTDEENDLYHIRQGNMEDWMTDW